MPITVIKLDIDGRETWRYQGEVLQHGQSCLVLEAFFDLEETSFHGMPLKPGDRFVETYYTDRWYNIFEIYGREDGKLRGWYCNITMPARLEGDRISWVDLALDLLVFPDGRQFVLDEEEFSRLAISSSVVQHARQALAELQGHFQQRKLPGCA